MQDEDFLQTSVAILTSFENEDVPLRLLAGSDGLDRVGVGRRLVVAVPAHAVSTSAKVKNTDIQCLIVFSSRL